MRSILLFFPVAAWLRKALEAGERWITVHPAGHEKGQPVLIRETKSGSGVYHVVGGAGGKLNYLKLRGVRSEAEYRKDAAQRRQERTEQRKEQRAKDKESGVLEKKDEAQKAVQSQRREQEEKFIRTVSEALGWTKEQTAFPEEKYAGVSDKALAKAGAQHHRALLQRAVEAVEKSKRELLADAEKRDAYLGAVPMSSTDPEAISVQDLDPIQPPSGLGFATHYEARAESAGLTAEQRATEKKEVEAQRPEEAAERIAKRRATAQAIAQELKDIQRPTLPPAKAAELEKTVSLLKAHKALRLVQQSAAEASREIQQSPEPKAYVLEVGQDDLDEQVRQEIENDVRTAATRAFLSEAAKEDEKALARHVGVGAYNAVNSLALTATGQALLDRDVVDVLGVAGAAQVLARRLKTSLSEQEYSDVQSALEDFHKDHYLKTSGDAIQEAERLHELAKQVEIDPAVTGGDLAVAMELNKRRGELIDRARQTLGTALGEMETNAALVMALKQGAKDELQVSLEGVSIDDAISRARAIGLQRGEYQIHKQGVDTFLTVNASGLDRMTRPVDREEMQAMRRTMGIIEGREDEDGWLPQGVANRPDLALPPAPEGVAPRLAEPFTPGADLERSIRDYIGGRAADGDPPASIVADLYSQPMVEQSGDAARYFAALDKLVPMKDAAGKTLRAEEHRAGFEGMADTFVQDRYGTARQPIHRQQVSIDKVTVESLHRALMKEPAGILAFKPVGDLDASEQGKLREWFDQHVGAKDTKQAKLQSDLEAHAANEPEREADDMFGRGTNPEWTAWKARHDELSEGVKSAGLNWKRYVELHHSPQAAYAAIQDKIRGDVVAGFAEAHNTLRPDAAVKLGRTVIAGNLAHLDAVDPEAREKRLADQRALVDSLRNRIQGRYSQGSVQDKIEAARERAAAMEQSQLGFFAAAEESERPLAADERPTIGHTAERQLSALMGEVGKNFKPGAPVKMFQPSMSGKFVNQQRAIKLIEANKRLGLHQGVGSGKTMVQLGAMAELMKQGKVKKAVHIVPSIVQGQYGGEALRFLEPGAFKWHAEPGASFAERLKAYRDPETNFSVVTHQAFRDDMLRLAAEQDQATPQAVADKMDQMSPADRKAYMRGVMDKAGINFDYLAVDEGHNLLNRAGKQNSNMANVIDAVSDNAPYYVNASADAMKNDASEIFSVLQKLAPDRYTDRATFMRRYGVDTLAARDGLKRELARWTYPGRIDPGVPLTKRELGVTLTDATRGKIAEIGRLTARARLARMKGEVDVESVKALAPHAFEGQPEEQHRKIAEELQRSVGIMHESAVRRVLDGPDSPKVEAIAREVKAKSGKPGLIFAHSLDAVGAITDRLRKEGVRVVTITGKDSSAEKDAKRRQFKPESGEAQADVMVLSDAGAVGLNAQRGQWVIQADIPQTALLHEQRTGRVHRLGQKNPVEQIDIAADHPIERRAKERLARKYQLRELMSSPLEALDDTGIAFYLKQRQMREAA